MIRLGSFLAGVALAHAVWVVVVWRLWVKWGREAETMRWALEKAINDQINSQRMYIRLSAAWYIDQAGRELESEAENGD